MKFQVKTSKNAVFSRKWLWMLVGFLLLNLSPVFGQQDTTTSAPPTEKYKPSKRPKPRPRDRYGDPYSNPDSKSPLLLPPPGKVELKLDDSLKNYTVEEKLDGNIDYRPPATLSFDEFRKNREREAMRSYMRKKANNETALEDKGISEIKIFTNPILNTLFGGNMIKIVPNGSIMLDLGVQFQRVMNPSLPVRQQNSFNFILDQQISLSLVGEIGEKLRMTVNWDTKAAFDFDNQIKIDYTSYDHEILKDVEAGNINMTVNSQLIRGAQNLFGVKTTMQFGKLTLTTALANQRGKADKVVINSGGSQGQGREFNIQCNTYEANRHFFLGHFFRDNYDRWLANLPIIASGVQVNRVEVYVTNRQANTTTLRNIIGLTDLGEGYRTVATNADYLRNGPPAFLTPTANDAHPVFGLTTNNAGVRDVNSSAQALEGLGLEKGTNFEVLRGARRLDPQRDYTINNQLGYISLNMALRDDEVVAVAFEYTYQGRVYRVGELSEDYQSRDQSEAIILKMLRPSTVRTRMPTWDLMMKNIYSLNATQMSRDGFQLRVIYRDDSSGVDNPTFPAGRNIRDQQIVRVLRSDQLNPIGEISADGNFDYIENVTVDARNGRVMFPVIEPFGNHLRNQFVAGEEDGLAQKYVFDLLYDSTQADALLAADKAKFFLKGVIQSSAANEVQLPGINIAKGSVSVTAGVTQLTEGEQFTVDYNLGRVTILDQGVLNSGQEITIRYEKSDLFNFQPRVFMGVRADYKFNEKLNLGGSLMHLRERPIIRRVNVGNEPVFNTIVGLDFNYKTDSRLITKMVDALPFISTKAVSNITMSGEVARLFPGSHSFIGKEGVSYIDDFEGSEIPFDLSRVPQFWKLSSAPAAIRNKYDPQYGADPLASGYHRAQLAWYNIDNAFYRENSTIRPPSIGPAQLSNHYQRVIGYNEIFKNRAREVVSLNQVSLDLAYYPEERGPYNYAVNRLNANGRFDAALARQNWAGIQRAVTTETDFDNANVQYIEFWLLDPFIEGEKGAIEGNTSAEGRDGQMFINLGTLSEDITPDERHGFENGLPTATTAAAVANTPWGRVTEQQYLTNGFDLNPGSRLFQDVGFDGLASEAPNLQTPSEAEFFTSVIAQAQQRITNTEALDAFINDPSADDFQYYLGAEQDNINADILRRYKYFNNPENNSPETPANATFTPSYTTLPDNEDMNNDNTLNTIEAYYEYKIDIRKDALQIGQNYIVDKVEADVEGEKVNWYLFRIPIRDTENPRVKTVGPINGFKSIRFIRTYLTGFAKPVVMRMVAFQLVASNWREYQKRLDGPGLITLDEPARFTISTVNIEENGSVVEGNIPYVLPPGIRRDNDVTTVNNRLLNEQSLSLCAEDLPAGTSKAVFKNVSLDFINYKKMRMFVHAQAPQSGVRDNEVSAFVRIGTDFTENFYEIEIPLKITPNGTTDPNEIWPSENQLNIDLNVLYRAKAARLDAGLSPTEPYRIVINDSGQVVTVVGNPDLSTVMTLMLGVRNKGTNDKLPKSLCVWFNELRVTDFDKKAGWGATGQMNMKMADLGNFTASGRYTTIGFGGVEDKIQQRERANTLNYNLGTTLQMQKFTPQKLGLQLPVFLGYQFTNIDPQFDPLNPDIPLEAAVAAREGNTPGRGEAYRRMVQDRTVRRSLNLSNISIAKMGDSKITFPWSVSNFALSYAYSDFERTNINIQQQLMKTYNYGLTYNYTLKTGYLEPFKNAKFLNGKYLKLIKEVNIGFLPENYSFQGQLDRMFRRTQLRGTDPFGPLTIAPMFEKSFTFNRNYAVRWSPAKSISIDYTAAVMAVIDEPEGDLTGAKRDTVINNLMNFGRTKNFNQSIRATYQIPFRSLPLTDWIAADVAYSASYNWQATALALQSTFGNSIQNTREQSINGRFDLVKLYSKSKFLAKLNAPVRPKPPTPKPTAKPNAQAGDKDSKDKKEDKPKPQLKGLRMLGRSIMMVRSVNARYSLTENTALPGYRPDPRYFGMAENSFAPGLGFVFGDQDPNIRYRAAQNGWLGNSTLQNNQFMQGRGINYSVSARVEPWDDLKIQLDAKKGTQASYSEVFRADSLGEFGSYNPLQTGNLNMSFLAINTAFQKSSGEFYSTPAFRDLERFRDTIHRRLTANNPLSSDSNAYSRNGQEVLIPAFLAAYSGSDPNKISLAPAPRFPMPNWRVDYNGLTKIKALKKLFPSISINHAYISNYSVASYNSSLQYDAKDFGLDRTPSDYTPSTKLGPVNDSLGQRLFVPLYVIERVAISEKFAPLFGINLRMENGLTLRFQYNWSRDVALNISNSQVTEMLSSDFVIGLGFAKANLTLPLITDKGRPIILKNQLNFRTDFTIRDTETTQRKLDDVNTITQGLRDFQLKPNLSYMVNRRLNIQMYYEYTITKPKLSNSFERRNTRFGIQVRFSLT